MEIRQVEMLPGHFCNLCSAACDWVIFDAPMATGHWAHMCEDCYMERGMEPATKFELVLKMSTGPFTKSDVLKHALSLSDEDIADMLLDRVAVITIDNCIVEPDGVCPHGYPSPLRVLGLI